MIINKLAIFIIANFFYTIDFQLLTFFNIFSFQLKLRQPQNLGLGLCSRPFEWSSFLKWSATEWSGNVLSGQIPQCRLSDEHNFIDLWKPLFTAASKNRFWFLRLHLYISWLYVEIFAITIYQLIQMTIPWFHFYWVLLLKFGMI